MNITRDEVKTGVFSLYSLEWINEAIDQAIDLDFEVYCKQCDQSDNEDCDCNTMTEPGETYLIGFKHNEKTDQYDIDEDQEYSAIVNSEQGTIQIARSDWLIDGGLCSPCYPNQVDADSTTGKIKGYAIPPNMIGYTENEDAIRLSSRIYHKDQGYSPAYRWIEHTAGVNFPPSCYTYQLVSEILHCISHKRQEYKYRIWRRQNQYDQFGILIKQGRLEPTDIYGSKFFRHIENGLEVFGDTWIDCPV